MNCISRLTLKASEKRSSYIQHVQPAQHLGIHGCHIVPTQRLFLTPPAHNLHSKSAPAHGNAVMSAYGRWLLPRCGPASQDGHEQYTRASQVAAGERRGVPLLLLQIRRPEISRVLRPCPWELRRALAVSAQLRTKTPRGKLLFTWGN